MKLQTSVADFSIRPAQETDCATILSFIKGLAEFEHLSQEVVATEEKLRQTLFVEASATEVIIGEYGYNPVAFALFFQSYSTFLAQPGLYLEDVFVDAAWRWRGFGSALLSYLAQLALERNCARLEWSVLDWNEKAIGLYRSLGAQAMDEWTVQRVTGQALADLAARL